jgi:plasmid stability protein
MPAHTPDAESQTRGATTTRVLAPALKARLRVRAAQHARSMEAEARAILEAALADTAEDTMDLATFTLGLFGPIFGVELELPPRDPAREPPDFGAARDAPPLVARDAPILINWIITR